MNRKETTFHKIHILFIYLIEDRRTIIDYCRGISSAFSYNASESHLRLFILETVTFLLKYLGLVKGTHIRCLPTIFFRHLWQISAYTTSHFPKFDSKQINTAPKTFYSETGNRDWSCLCLYPKGNVPLSQKWEHHYSAIPKWRNDSDITYYKCDKVILTKSQRIRNQRSKFAWNWSRDSWI